MSVSTAPSLQLAEYLEKLPGTTFRKLYQQPSTAFAIFRRMLPHLGTQTRPLTVQPRHVVSWGGLAR
jgi:transcription initiation factor TFIIH subunit 4